MAHRKEKLKMIYATVHFVLRTSPLDKENYQSFRVAYDEENLRPRTFIGDVLNSSEQNNIVAHLADALALGLPLSDMPFYTMRNGHVASNDGWVSFNHFPNSRG